MVTKLSNAATPTELVEKTNELIGDYDEYIKTKYLPVTGGSITGTLSVDKDVTAKSNLAITKNITVSGTTTAKGTMTVDNDITGKNIKATGHFITASGIEFF